MNMGIDFSILVKNVIGIGEDCIEHIDCFW
jgi:hypothetical protein